jgi:hypothetical protein
VFKPGLPKAIEIRDSEGDWSWPTAPVRRVIIAASDNTHLTLEDANGAMRTVELRRADVWADDPNDALVGQAVLADRPISVMSFGPTSYIPWDFPMNGEADGHAVFSSALPSALWGSEYVAVRHGDRWAGMPERPPWRVIGGSDGTALSYEPYKPDGAPDTLQRGQLAVFFADEPFVIRSQDPAHAFYLGGHMASRTSTRGRAAPPRSSRLAAPRSFANSCSIRAGR